MQIVGLITSVSCSIARYNDGNIHATCLQITSPACTELEVAMMDWLGKLIQLPQEFLNCSDGPGGGVIQVPWLAGRTIDDN